MERDAFISYSHTADVPLAAALEKGLQGIVRTPWLRRPGLKIFRDTTSLGASHDLGSAITSALAGSRHFIYLASPEAAQSKWVRQEIAYWRRNHGMDRFLVAFSAGVIKWDDTAGDFDWTLTDALPRELSGAFASEPLYVDLRPFRTCGDGDRSMAQGADFRDKVVTLAAPVHGREKDELDSADLRMQRKASWILRSFVAGLVVVSLIAVSAGAFAWQQRGEALARARTSASQALAARSVHLADTDPRKAAQLALYAEAVRPTSESAQALARAVAANANVARHFQGGSGAVVDFSGSGGGTPTQVAVSRDGSMLAYYSGFDADDPNNEDAHIHLYDIRGGKELPVLRGKGWAQGGGVLELTADGGMLVVERAFNEVEVWDVRRGQLLREIVASNGRDLPNAGLHLKGFALARDGSRIAAAFYEPNVDALRMAVWDTASGAELSRTDAGADSVTLIFDDAGQLRADDSEGGKYRTFNAATRTWSAVRTQPQDKDKRTGSTGTALRPAPAPDKREMLIGAEGGTVAVYDAQRRRQRTLGSFSFPVQSLSVSGDGTWVAAGSNDGAVSLFRTADPTVGRLPNDDGLKSSEVTEDGRIGLRKDANRGTDVWLLTDRKAGLRKAGNMMHEVEAISVARDGRPIVVADSRGALSVWDGKTGLNPKDLTLFLDGPYLFNGEGTRTIQLVGDDAHVVGAWPQGLKVVDLRTMNVSQVLEDKEVLGDLAVSRDGMTLAATDQALGTVTVWRWADGRLQRVRHSKITERRIVDSSVSDDGSKVAVVDSDQRITVLRVADGRLASASTVAQNAQSHVVFSPDSRLVTQLSYTGTESRLNFWDAATGDSLGFWPLGASGAAGAAGGAEGNGASRIFTDPEGGLLALGPDGSLTRHTIDVAEWRSTLCAYVPDPLPRAEYDRYLSDLDVDAPCGRR
ncbi:TIR domain-containing protein [Streptomyces sp. NPDC048337]|uniref:TIR domain-containing protein n=1 Tax=Streptomyces sp. NPDC048337 TaxID=3365535 RepID=UPI00372021E3